MVLVHVTFKIASFNKYGKLLLPAAGSPPRAGLRTTADETLTADSLAFGAQQACDPSRGYPY